MEHLKFWIHITTTKNSSIWSMLTMLSWCLQWDTTLLHHPLRIWFVLGRWLLLSSAALPQVHVAQFWACAIQASGWHTCSVPTLALESFNVYFDICHIALGTSFCCILHKNHAADHKNQHILRLAFYCSFRHIYWNSVGWRHLGEQFSVYLIILTSLQFHMESLLMQCCL